ncbi:hypothetical protein EDB81DRAFT_362900 [Dactylonectria macrodidyma]|uniref:Uncharacterized protein n=1 Tax=Dactylonectria macrodidyma TaxID=307937 RepID=A0A9P9I9F1_9HYPO|nr:hypothetical protein EDB81DRAFT_362900 [Dactylonectria macrodidyma]
MTRSQFAATITAFAFSTMSNFFVIMTIYALYVLLPHELPGSSFLSTQSLRLRFRGSFLTVAIVQLLVAIGAETAFAVLSFVDQRDWAIYLLCSIVLSSMLRECVWTGSSWNPGQRSFFPYHLVSILVLAGPSFIVGTIVTGYHPVTGRIIASSSIVCYQLWMVWEWARIVADALQEKKRPLFHLMVHILTFGASTPGTQLESRVDVLLVASNALALNSLVVCAYPVVERWLRYIKGSGHRLDEASMANLFTILPL